MGQVPSPCAALGLAICTFVGPHVRATGIEKPTTRRVGEVAVPLLGLKANTEGGSEAKRDLSSADPVRLKTAIHEMEAIPLLPS